MSILFESIEHGEKYPANIFVTSIDHSSFHWHYDYELILVLKGELLINISPKQSVLKTGDILFVNSKSVHEIQHTEKENLCLFIQLSKYLFTDPADAGSSYFFYLNSTDKSKLPKNGFEKYRKLAAEIGYEFQKNTLDGMYRTKSYIYMLVADMFEYVLHDIHQESAGSVHTEDLDLLMNIIAFFSKNYRNDNPAKEYCESNGLSNKTLYRFMKKYIGISPEELILQNRIESSKYLLKYTDKSIPYISSECGFGSENTFYRVFKNKVGVTPSGYRKNDITPEKNPQIKGYLHYSMKESSKLLKKFSQGGI